MTRAVARIVAALKIEASGEIRVRDVEALVDQPDADAGAGVFGRDQVDIRAEGIRSRRQIAVELPFVGPQRIGSRRAASA